MIGRDEFNHLILSEDYDAIVSLFDEEPGAVRRLLTRLTFDPGTPLQKNAIRAFAVLSKKRADDNKLFFTDTIRQHVWGMNDESSNIDWSAPEIIGAIIAGRLDLYSRFIPIMFYNALPEPIFHNSILSALHIIAEEDPEIAAPYLEELSLHFAPLQLG